MKKAVFEKMTAELSSRKDRSAWDKGVTLYAKELVENLEERTEWEERLPENEKELKEWALNGSKNWTEYSYIGSSLIYDKDIAERLCTPSELKRTRGGERRPNSHEKWLDTQARALYQACYLVSDLYRQLIAE